MKGSKTNEREAREALEELFDDSFEGSDEKKKKDKQIRWSPDVIEPSRPISKPSLFSVLDDGIEHEEDPASPSEGKSSRKKKRGKNGDKPGSPTKREQPGPIGEDVSSSSVVSSSASSSSVEGWIILIMCILLVVFSISDYGMADWYRGNGSINRLLINRGFLASYSTEAESKQAAKDLLKKYVQVDSTIFERPFDGSAKDIGADVSALNDGISDKLTNNGLLLMEITSPTENAIIDKDCATLSLHASGAALAALDPQIFTMNEDGSASLPDTRTMRIKARLDGTELSFLTGDSYEIGLKDTVQITFDLLEHGLLEPQQALTGVHLLELELVLEAYSEFTEGRLMPLATTAASPSSAPSASLTPSEAVGVLRRVSATSSVAFLFLDEDELEQGKVAVSVTKVPAQAQAEAQAQAQTEAETQAQVGQDGAGTVEQVARHDGSRHQSHTGAPRQNRHLELSHPQMNRDTGTVTLRQPLTEESTVEVELTIALSLATLKQGEVEGGGEGTVVWVIFALGPGNHTTVDITSMVREQMQQRGVGAEGTETQVVSVPVGLRGVLEAGTHVTTVSVVQTSQAQQLVMSPVEIVQTGEVLASSSLTVVISR